MIRVAHLMDGKFFGGAEEALLRLARHLDAGRVSFEAILMHRGRLAERLQALGAPVASIRPRRATGLGASRDLRRLTRERRYDIVHSHAAGANLIARLACRHGAARHVATVHSPIRLDINDRPRGRRFHEMVDRFGWRWSERVIFVSEEERARCVARGLAESRAVWIPNGVEMADPPSPERVEARRRAWGLEPGAPTVIMVAQLRPRKGPEILLRAMPIVRRAIPGARALFVGDAAFVASRDYLAELQALAASLGVADAVIFTGFCDDPAAALELADVAVLPSRFGEGLPLALLEAMAAGKAIVATDVPGNREAVRDGVNGRLTEPENPHALAEALTALLQDRRLRETMGAEGRRHAAARYDMRRVARRHEALYEEIMEIK